jgi:hypothetical protein
VSPTAPSFSTLNEQLNKAHRRIRQLEARELELLARIAMNPVPLMHDTTPSLRS